MFIWTVAAVSHRIALVSKQSKPTVTILQKRSGSHWQGRWWRWWRRPAAGPWPGIYRLPGAATPFYHTVAMYALLHYTFSLLNHTFAVLYHTI